MKKVILSAKNLSKKYEAGKRVQKVLDEMSLEIYEGDFTVIMGPSGAGKSTLMYVLSGMDKPTSGEVNFNDRRIDNLSENALAIFRRANCGFVFQQIHLVDNLSVMDNILSSGLLMNKKKSEVVSKAKELLASVNIDPILWGKLPSQLSGGEQQRVGIVRAMINDPCVLFADEPTGALNSTNSDAVLDSLTDFNKKGQSIVMVTHDLKSVRRGSRVVYLNDGKIAGECVLGEYNGEDEGRARKLDAFCKEMKW